MVSAFSCVCRSAWVESRIRGAPAAARRESAGAGLVGVKCAARWHGSCQLGPPPRTALPPHDAQHESDSLLCLVLALHPSSSRHLIGGWPASFRAAIM